MSESRKRSVAKAFSWRVIALMITVVAAWIFTGDTTKALEIGALDTAVKIFAYYAHERMWLRVRFGMPTPRQPDYQI